MIRVKRPAAEKSSYVMDGRDAARVKIVGFLGLASTIFVLLGYLQFIHISPYVAAFFLPLMMIISAYQIIQYGLLARYQGFDLARHQMKIKDYWAAIRKSDLPNIAVFIPAAGEAENVVEGTIAAACKIRYPSYKVFVLDDSKEGMYKSLAVQYKIGYIRRSDVGRHKKAGNMNFGLGSVKGFSHVLVLDADFQPRPEILLELTPYLGDDIGIIQTPQHFNLDADTHSRSKIEYGAAYIQRDFYRITQVARNRYGAAICVGTSALYNIAALKRVGGYEGVGQSRGWGHSEDVYTGLKMLNTFNSRDKQYRIMYIPLQLTKGTCPDEHHSFYKQQNRWATGSMQLFLSSKTARSTRLSVAQRICYGSNALYYFYTMTLLLSPVYLLVLALSSQPSSWAFTLYFIPSLAVHYIVEPFVLRRPFAPLATSLVVISNAYTFVQALVLLVIRKPLGWEATGSKGQKKKSAHFTHFKLVAVTGFMVMYIVTLGILIMNEQFQYGPSVFILIIFLTSFLAHLAFLLYVLVQPSKKWRMLLDRKLYTALFMLILMCSVVYGAATKHNEYDIEVRDSRLILEEETVASYSDSPLDGLRRTRGDLEELFGL